MTTSKACTKCGVVKPLDGFGKRADTPVGLRADCKACQSIVHRAYYVANRAKVIAVNVEWRAANPDKDRAYSAKRRAANPEKARAADAKWAAANPEKRRASITKWQAANHEARRIHQHNRRARKREAGGKLSRGLAERLFKLQRGKCACGCRQPLGDDYHMDHITPLALGGANTDDNIQLLRQRCNNQKHAKHPVAFMQSKGFLL